jgi:hypothetical protein
LTAQPHQNRCSSELHGEAFKPSGAVSASPPENAVCPGYPLTIAQLLTQDAKADGQFDGRGAGGAQLQTAGNPPQMLDASWLRYAMAQALDEWFKTTQNKTGLTSSDLQNAGVFDTVASDTSILFPSSVVPQPYDNTPPTMTLSAKFTNGGQTTLPWGVGGKRS